MKAIETMTTEELLRDYISFHYVEGNIDNETRVTLEFAAKDYLEQLSEPEQLNNLSEREKKEPKEVELSEEEKNPIIDFATWYSGMERSKVERAYKMYLKEQ